MSADPRRIQDLFLQLAELPPTDRLAALERECGSDGELRQRVGALLQAHGEPDSYLDQPGGNLAVTLDSGVDEAESAATGEHGRSPDVALVSHASQSATTDEHRDSRPGIVIGGRYTLQEKIGEGGMGEVWVAKQTIPVKRKVAIKLIKTGMDSRAVLQRFEQERQALALMDHPNIARVLDGGITPTGQPFFVMELVNGLALNKFCDASKLTLRERLELFVPICQAVQHAHQKGIVHRDLKPANILVTIIDGKPIPKVIDFGVAKATSGKLTEETMSTGFGAVVGTLEYMSPEQAGFSGSDIDTRADIYSLGVILYELLTGLRPIDAVRLRKAALTEMVRIIQEEEPSKPSTRLSTDEALPSMAALRQTDPKRLMAMLRGELDWVVMKCLEKQRDRRYDTANALVRDIQRYLADEVVEARPPSASYRLQKFVRRNKGQVIAASLVLLVLVAGIVGTTWGLFEARRQETFARSETAQKGEALTAKEKALKAEAERVKERDSANDELKHQLGVSEMVLAVAAFDNRDVKLSTDRLDRVPAKQRGWDWRYLKQQATGGIFTLYGHTSPVTCVAYSPDGTRILTGGGNQHQPFEAKVWDARTGAFLFELKGLPASLEGVNIPTVSVVFSPDSKRIATGGSDRIARIWDAKTGALQLELKEHADGVRQVAFSPDGARLVTTSDHGEVGDVKVWDAKTGALVMELKGHKHWVTQASYSPDGTRILTGDHHRSVKVWDAQSGAKLLDIKGIMSEEGSVAFSPDGKRIIGGRDDGTATVVDAQTGAIQLELKARLRMTHSFAMSTMGVLSAAFSPDGSRIVTGGGIGATGEASVWDARTGAELVELRGHTNLVMSVAFNADGTRVITGSADGTAKVWDARTGTQRLEFGGIPGIINCVAISPDGSRIVAGGGVQEKSGEATVWDARMGTALFELKGFKGAVKSVAFSSDGTRIVTGVSGDDGNGDDTRIRGGEAIVWDAQTGARLFDVQGLKEGVGSVSFSPDGTRIVTAGLKEFGPGGTELKVWDARSHKLLFDLTPAKQPDVMTMGERGGSVAFSGDGTRFVTGGLREAGLGDDINVRDAKTGKVLIEMKGHKGAVRCIAFSKDGTRIVTGSAQKMATVWDARTGKALFDLTGHTGDVNSVAFNADGTRIVTGSGDATIRVWDARTGTTLVELKGHRDGVNSVALSKDGTRIISGGGGNHRGKPAGVIVWDASVPKEDWELKGHTSSVRSAAFSPDGAWIATSSDKTVKIWDLKSRTVLVELKGFERDVSSLAFSRDGGQLATGGSDATVKLWNVKTGAPLAELKTDYIKSALFSLDGARIVTEGFDRAIAAKVWDIKTGQELKGEVIPKTVACGRTSPDGQLFAYLNDNHICLVAISPDPDELAHRLLLAQPNLGRYREGYLSARAAKDDFAAAFYLQLVPEAERTALLAKAEEEAQRALAMRAEELQRAGKLDEALPLLADILKTKQEKLGSDAPETLRAMDTLGRVHWQMGQFDKSVVYLEDVLKRRKAKLGPSDPQTLSAMAMVGTVYKDAGRLQEAIRLLEEGAEKDGWVMQTLQEVYTLAGEHAKLVNLLLKQLEGVRKSQPEATQYHAALLEQIGAAYLGLKKWDDAEPSLRECVALRKKAQPEEWNTFLAQSLLGWSLLGQKKYSEAEPLLLAGYQGIKEREAALPEPAKYLREAVDRLVELYMATGKVDEVKKWQTERAKYPPPPTASPPEKKAAS